MRENGKRDHPLIQKGPIGVESNSIPDKTRGDKETRALCNRRYIRGDDLALNAKSGGQFPLLMCSFCSPEPGGNKTRIQRVRALNTGKADQGPELDCACRVMRRWAAVRVAR